MFVLKPHNFKRNYLKIIDSIHKEVKYDLPFNKNVLQGCTWWFFFIVTEREKDVVGAEGEVAADVVEDEAGDVEVFEVGAGAEEADEAGVVGADEDGNCL